MTTSIRTQVRVQKLFLIVLGAFLLFLVSALLYRSYSRKSLLVGGRTEIGKIEVSLGGSEVAGKGAEVRLQQFHRVEVKDGRPSWEITAKEARYFPDEGITLVSDAELLLFGNRNSRTRIRAKDATLAVAGSELLHADLRGSVVFSMDDSVFVECEAAAYDVKSETLNVPNEVKISGVGYEVTGQGMNANLRTRQLVIQRKVGSRFESYAEAPESGIVSGAVMPDK